MITLIGLIVLVGVILWAVNYAPFIDENFKRIIYIIVVLITAVYLLRYFGIMPNLK